MSLYDDTQSVLISKQDIAKKVKGLAQKLTEEYADKNPVMICILKGSFVFFADLLREMDIPLEVEFIAISSYGSGSKTSGEVKVVKDTDKSLENRHVLIIEDIIDSGLTLSYLKNMLARRAPASIKICALLDKPERREINIEADYLGFKIPNHFVVGYGLDFAQRYRNIPDICILKKSVYS